VGEGTVVTLRGAFSAESFRAAIGPSDGTRIVSLEDNAAMVSVTGERRAASDLLATILRAGIDVADITMQEPSLQSVFIKLTGRELRD
jgi:hypothetical protein